MIGTLTDEWATPMSCWPIWSRKAYRQQLQRVEHSYNVNDLINGKVQAMAIYTTNEPELFERRGFPTKSTVRVRSASISMATICSRAKRKLPTIRPVCGPSAASMRGWQWAMSHPEETVDLILKYYARRGDRQHLLYEARQMVPLVQPVLVEIGYMNPERWRHIADVYAGLGMVPKQVSLDGFLYNVDSSASRLRWLYRALAAVAVLLLVGAVIHYSMLTRERRRTNAEIRAGEQRFRTMFEASPLGIALIDSVTYEYRDINPRYQEILGRSHEVLSNMRWLDSGHPDDVAQVKAQMTRLMAREISSFKVSNRMFRSDGEMVWIAVSVTAIETRRTAMPCTCA
jgi:PAS domain S-box-containing protein